MGRGLDRALERAAEMAGGLIGGHRRPDGPAELPEPGEDVPFYSAQAVHDIPAGHTGVDQSRRGVLPPIIPRFQPAPPPPGDGTGDEPGSVQSPEPQIWASLPYELPTQPARPARTLRTPGRAAARSHLLVGAVVTVLAVVALGAFWFVELHPRISQAALQRGVAARTGAPTVRCVASKTNGAVWTCGIIYGAESVCDLANVSVFGSWKTVAADSRRCTGEPALVGLVPKVTAAGVKVALQHDYGNTVAVCARATGYHSRWDCIGRTSSGTLVCTRVRAVAWTPFNPTSVPVKECEHVPGLRHATG